MNQAWKKWMRVSKKVVSIQASIVFGFLFIIILTPLSVVIRIINPNVFMGSAYVKRKNSYWNKIPKRKYDLNFARKQ